MAHEQEHSNGGHETGGGHEAEPINPAQVEEKRIRDSVFLAVLLGLAVLAGVFFVGAGFIFDNLMLIVAVLLFAYLGFKYDYLIKLKEYERAVIFTFGRTSGVSGPGWVFVFPPFQSFEKVDLRQKVLDVPPQTVVPKDSVSLQVDALIYLNIKRDKESILKSVLDVQDVEDAAKKYVVASLRDVVGNISLTDLISNIEDMNRLLKTQLEKIATAWGVNVEAVKLQSVDIPKVVLDAMLEEKPATQKKLARFEEAEAHQREIEAVRNAAENLSDKALTYYYIRALEKIGQSSSTKFVFPMELTRLAESITNKKMSGAEIESLFKRFAPKIRALAKK
ncbi:MAG: SPFH domain-containing protein [Candidatus Diapherotrites archaeon]|nr:SPFH domain-containing protein [Candidatus Diapherotrites archaeon]